MSPFGRCDQVTARIINQATPSKTFLYITSFTGPSWPPDLFMRLIQSISARNPLLSPSLNKGTIQLATIRPARSWSQSWKPRSH